MDKDCSIRLVYNNKYVGNLFLKYGCLDILTVKNYIKLLINNYNTNLVNYPDKTLYEFLVNFFQASDKNGNNILIPVNLRKNL